MLLSVIIPTFNCNETLERIICDLFAITACKVEIIIIDDGSKKESLEILHKIESIESRNIVIKVLYNQHQGVSFSRNCGIRYSNGDYITFVDDDDRINSQAYNDLIYYAIKNPNLDVISASINVKEKHSKKIFEQQKINKILLSTLHADIDEFDSVEYPMGPYGKFFLRKMLMANNIVFPEDMFNGEDMVFNWNVLLHCQKLLLIEEQIYTYINDGLSKQSLMHSFFPDLNENNKSFFNNICKVVKTTSLSEVENIQLTKYWKVRLTITNILRQYSVSLEETSQYVAEVALIKQITADFNMKKYILEKLTIDQRVLLNIIVNSPVPLIIPQVKFVKSLKSLKKILRRSKNVEI